MSNNLQDKSDIFIEDIDNNVENIEDKIDIIDGVVDQIDGKVDTVNGNITVIDGNVDDIKNSTGSLNDTITIPFTFGVSSILAHLNTIYYHIHGASFIYPDKTIPVLLTSDATSWGIAGTPTEIIPLNGITKNFDLHWASIADISAILYGIIDLYGDDGSGWFKIGPVCDVVRTSNFSREGFAPVQVPQQPANRRIGAIFSDNTTSIRTVRIKVYGHVYGSSLI